MTVLAQVVAWLGLFPHENFTLTVGNDPREHVKSDIMTQLQSLHMVLPKV